MGLLLYCLGGKNLDYISTNLFSALTSNGTPGETNTWVSTGTQVTSGTESFGAYHVLVAFRYK